MSGSSAAQPVKTLFVTLMRGYAGKPWFHRKALEALGLKTRHQCVEVPNSPNVRGRLLKVPHLVRVETDAMFLKRKTAQAQADALRPPLRFQHAPAAPAAARQARQ